MDSSVGDTDRAAEETADGRHGRVDGDGVADEDVSDGRVEVEVPDECEHDRRKAGGGGGGGGPGPEDRRVGPDDPEVRDAGAGESDDDCSGEATRLEACMTPSGQDYYLRRGGTPRRRSALRLSRIIARQQLLRRLSQGRGRDYSGVCFFFTPELFNFSPGSNKISFDKGGFSVPNTCDCCSFT